VDSKRKGRISTIQGVTGETWQLSRLVVSLITVRDDLKRLKSGLILRFDETGVFALRIRYLQNARLRSFRPKQSKPT